jgi:3-methyladenine DNA glycosylase/8-oxoguanine DNA glycosylase
MVQGVKAHPIAERLFELYPKPEDITPRAFVTLSTIFLPLGLAVNRAKYIIDISERYSNGKTPKNVTDCKGVGKYAKDSYDIFILGKLDINPTDKILKAYITEKTGRKF